MQLRLRWLGTACFEIRMPNGSTIVIDPYIDDSVSAPIYSEQIENCDYIFITHGHFDHVLDTGKLAKRFNPTILCSRPVATAITTYLDVDPALIKVISANDRIDANGLFIEVIPGRHVDFLSEYKRLTGSDISTGQSQRDIGKIATRVVFDTDSQPPLIDDWMRKFVPGAQLNFVFQSSGGPRIYMAGTWPDADQIDIASTVFADITLLQVPPGNSIKGMEEATARLAKASGCKVVVPQHHDRLLRGAKNTDLTKLIELLTSDENCLVFNELVPGKWYEFDQQSGQFFLSEQTQPQNLQSTSP